jgi:3-hydroxyisobutyrate dehydrogenase-like beta-hydroxyacid dehydrogenase
MVQKDVERPTIGFIGLGAMGGPMAANLLRAGYAVVVFDTNPARVAECEAKGGHRAANAGDVVAASEVILLSLPSSDAFVDVADRELLPVSRTTQVFIDLGTTTPPETRRLAAVFVERGAALLDVPLSGGSEGAQAARLRMFAGGDRAVFDQCRPILEILGGSDHLTYCGPSGSGQIVKGVNQLAMGLGTAAYLEALAFGVRAGVDAALLSAAVGSHGGNEHWREQLHWLADRIADGGGNDIGVKFRELPYFIREAQEQGQALPLTESLYAFCDRGERVVIDDNRPAPSFWHELLYRSN